MTTLNITVTTRKMPHTSEFFAICKAIEHFYYALLFSTEPEYSAIADRWSSWLEMGFSNAIKDAPLQAAAADRLRRTVFSDGKIIAITVSSSKDEIMQTLARLLGGADLGGKIEDEIRVPVAASLASVGADAHSTASIIAMIERGREALTYKDITSIEVTMGDRDPAVLTA